MKEKDSEATKEVEDDEKKGDKVKEASAEKNKLLKNVLNNARIWSHFVQFWYLIAQIYAFLADDHCLSII